MESDGPAPNVKSFNRQESVQGKWRARPKTNKYERFGETIRFLTIDELQSFFDSISRYEHKLMFRLAYEMGCRVGELVRIQLKHLDFINAAILIPAEHTKTRQKRTSFISPGLMNEVRDWLRRQGLLRRSQGALRRGDVYLFRSRVHPRKHMTENRVRQIFQGYVHKAGLDREYGKDSQGRSLHQFTVHSLRHSHCIHYIHTYKVPIPLVQRQVGHRTLQATMIYCRPTTEMVRDAYTAARNAKDRAADGRYLRFRELTTSNSYPSSQQLSPTAKSSFRKASMNSASRTLTPPS